MACVKFPACSTSGWARSPSSCCSPSSSSVRRSCPDLATGLGELIREIRKATADVKNEIVLDDTFRKPFEELRDAVTLAPEELKRRDDARRRACASRPRSSDARSGEAAASGDARRGRRRRRRPSRSRRRRRPPGRRPRRRRPPRRRPRRRHRRPGHAAGRAPGRDVPALAHAGAAAARAAGRARSASRRRSPASMARTRT